jgi:putative oxidoreductase
MAEKGRDLGLFVLRLSGVALAVWHGFGKIAGLAGGESGFAQGVAELGFPQPGLFAWAAALAEGVGGCLIALGLLTRVSAGLAGVTMAIAAFGRHRLHEQLLSGIGIRPLSAEALEEMGNPEKALVYLLVFLALVLLGPGRWSLDHLIFRRGRRG